MISRLHYTLTDLMTDENLRNEEHSESWIVFTLFIIFVDKKTLEVEMQPSFGFFKGEKTMTTIKEQLESSSFYKRNVD